MTIPVVYSKGSGIRIASFLWRVVFKSDICELHPFIRCSFFQKMVLGTTENTLWRFLSQHYFSLFGQKLLLLGSDSSELKINYGVEITWTNVSHLRRKKKQTRQKKIQGKIVSMACQIRRMKPLCLKLTVKAIHCLTTNCFLHSYNPITQSQVPSILILQMCIVYHIWGCSVWQTNWYLFKQSFSLKRISFLYPIA